MQKTVVVTRVRPRIKWYSRDAELAEFHSLTRAGFAVLPRNPLPYSRALPFLKKHPEVSVVIMEANLRDIDFRNQTARNTAKSIRSLQAGLKIIEISETSTKPTFGDFFLTRPVIWGELLYAVEMATARQ